MVTGLSVSELTGLLESICLDRGPVPKFVTNHGKYDRDSLENAGIKNRVHLTPTGFGAEIAKHLRHIPVNPHNDIVSELLRLSYVYNSTSCRRPSNDDQVLNQSDFSLFAFMSTIIKSARIERQFSIDPKGSQSTIESLFTSCVHVIYGERGIGKTFFLNYALTRCNEILDRRKTIWVRLNFVYTTGFEEDLEYWMHAQACKIIFRYYDKKSTREGKRVVSALDYLFDWIQKNDRFTDEDRTSKRAALRSMEQVFSRGGGDEVIRPSLCDREICRELYHFMRANGWAFIFVLDGFDQLDISPEQIDRFEKIRSSVQRFISMRATFGAAIVVVTRSNTFDDLKSYDPFKGIPQTRKFKIVDVDFDKVVRQRFQAIKEVVIRRIPYHRRETAEKLESTIQNFIDNVFTRNAMFAETDKFIIANIRHKLQTLYLMFLDFVDETTGKGYLILEHMLLNGMRYPPAAYQYESASRNELVPRADEITHEARFLPLITRYPLSRASSLFAFPNNAFSHLLLGVRILQICRAAKNLLKNQELLSVGELMSILSAAFSYSAVIQYAMVQELAAFDMLRMIRNEGLPAGSRSNRISVLPKSEYLLDECLHNVAYLNMCAMRTSFTSEFYAQRFVQCAYLGSAQHDAHAWVESKMVNSIALFSTMVFQNRAERAALNLRSVDALPDRERTVWAKAVGDGLWDLIPNSRSMLTVEIMQILTSGPVGWLTAEDKELIADRVRKMFAIWRQPIGNVSTKSP